MYQDMELWYILASESNILLSYINMNECVRMLQYINSLSSQNMLLI